MALCLFDQVASNQIRNARQAEHRRDLEAIACIRRAREIAASTVLLLQNTQGHLDALLLDVEEEISMSFADRHPKAPAVQLLLVEPRAISQLRRLGRAAAGSQDPRPNFLRAPHQTPADGRETAR